MMILFSVVIALILERILPQLVEFRRFDWLSEYTQWLADMFNFQRTGAWLASAIVLFPLILLIWILSGMFENALFGLFELTFNIAVIFFCLGPRELDSQVDHYLDAIDVGSSEQRLNSASRLTIQQPSSVVSEQVIQVCKAILVAANTRLYAVLFWFVVFGPVAAVLFRVIERLSQNQNQDETLLELKRTLSVLLGWINWLPTRISLFAYMVSGNFDDGMQAFRSETSLTVDMNEQNNELLQNVGFASMASRPVENDTQAMEMVRKSRGLYLRSLMVWLFLLLLISVL
jgi:AmpE protein